MTRRCRLRVQPVVDRAPAFFAQHLFGLQQATRRPGVAAAGPAFAAHVQHQQTHGAHAVAAVVVVLVGQGGRGAGAHHLALEELERRLATAKMP